MSPIKVTTQEEFITEMIGKEDVATYIYDYLTLIKKRAGLGISEPTNT